MKDIVLLLWIIILLVVNLKAYSNLKNTNSEIYFDAKQKARKKYGNKSTSIGNDDNKTP